MSNATTWRPITIELDPTQWDAVLDLMRQMRFSADDVVGYAVTRGLEILTADRMSVR